MKQLDFFREDEAATLGELFCFCRREKGWTTKQAAAAAGLSYAYYITIENDTKIPDVKCIIRLAQVFDRDPGVWAAYRLQEWLAKQGLDYQVTATRLSDA